MLFTLRQGIRGSFNSLWVVDFAAAAAAAPLWLGGQAAFPHPPCYSIIAGTGGGVGFFPKAKKLLPLVLTFFLSLYWLRGRPFL